jgi:GLPGLI family protein
MKKNLLTILILCYLHSFGQNYKITYQKYSNGNLEKNQESIAVVTNVNQTKLYTEYNSDKGQIYPEEFTTIDRKSSHICQYAILNKLKTIFTKDSLSLTKQSFEFLSETKKILGYNCKKAKTIINSNTIEIWYTDELKVKGSPTILGQDLGLVLEIVRNGNYVITSSKIEKVKSIPTTIVSAEAVDVLTYKDLLWKSRFTTIPIFQNQIINFSDEGTKTNLTTTSDTLLRFVNGTVAIRKVKFPEIKSGSQIFVDVTEQSNGDAYDRTGCFFIIPTTKSISFLDGLKNGIKLLPIYDNGNGKEYQGVVAKDNYEPIIELMRFFTPFGVGKYNSIQLKNKVWADQVFYRQDVTDFRSMLSNQEVYIGINIGNYDKGGHKISANFTIHNEPEVAITASQIVPLFCTNNIMEMAGQEYGTMFSSDKGLEINFKLDKPIKNCKLRYITTGHGGWENGDEYLPKKNSIFLDGIEVYHFTPWRQDCGSYRLSNPASGNFANGLSSSDYSRSNWCPGTVTNPIYIDLGNLENGTHTMQIKIPLGKPEGNSFSAWNISGVLIGE